MASTIHTMIPYCWRLKLFLPLASPWKLLYMKCGLHHWLFLWKDPQGIAVAKVMSLLKAHQIALQKDFHGLHEVMCLSDTQKRVHCLECRQRDLRNNRFFSEKQGYYWYYSASEVSFIWMDQGLLFLESFSCTQTYRKIYKCMAKGNAFRHFPS